MGHWRSLRGFPDSLGRGSALRVPRVVYKLDAISIRWPIVCLLKARGEGMVDILLNKQELLNCGLLHTG